MRVIHPHLTLHPLEADQVFHHPNLDIHIGHEVTEVDLYRLLIRTESVRIAAKQKQANGVQEIKGRVFVTRAAFEPHESTVTAGKAIEVRQVNVREVL